MRVSVIISNRNDDAMLSITVRSILEELRPLGRDGEVVIVDNSDQNIWEKISAGAFIPHRLINRGSVRMIRQDYPCLFTARETAIREAKSDLVICVDSHMLIGRDMIEALVSFMESRRGDDTMGFAHAPISWCHHDEENAKHDRDMSTSELGDWNRQYSEPRTITWKGMPWIVRKSTWDAIGGYGALSEHRISWGGGDMHIGIKPWLLGFKNWAVPCAPGIHIGPFPKESKNYKYRLYSESGQFPASFGFFVACYVLGGDAMVARNKEILWNRKDFGWQRFGRERFEDHIVKARELALREREWLVARQKLTFDELLRKQPWNQ